MYERSSEDDFAMWTTLVLLENKNFQSEKEFRFISQKMWFFWRKWERIFLKISSSEVLRENLAILKKSETFVYLLY